MDSAVYRTVGTMGELRVIWVIPFAPLISVVWNQLNGKVLQGELCYD